MSVQDPYQLLGVTRSASQAEIKSAYRKLAKKLHPDLNPNRKDIEQKFKDVSSAYALLSDKDKRARFDRGEIDSSGNESYPHYSSNGPRGRQRSSGSPFGFGGGGINPEDIFSEFFGGNKRGFNKTPPPQRGADITYILNVSFIEACLGEKKRVTLSSGKTIDVAIPPGTEDGHKLRLRGLGQASPAGAGDAFIEIKVQKHSFFTREGNDIHLDVPISLPEAILGDSIKIPTLSGSVTLKINQGTNTDRVMRLKGKGIPASKGLAGDMFVKLKIMLPDNAEAIEKLSLIIEKWAKKYTYNPRQKRGWE